MNEIIFKLYLAVEKENLEIIKLLLSNDKIDINILNIFINIFIKFTIKYFNDIKNQLFHQTVLHNSVIKQNIDMVKVLLVNSKIDINIKNNIFLCK